MMLRLMTNIVKIMEPVIEESSNLDEISNSIRFILWHAFLILRLIFKRWIIFIIFSNILDSGYTNCTQSAL